MRVRSLGIVIEPGAGKPLLLAVLASGDRDDPALEDEFDIPGGGTDPSEQAYDLARLLQGKLAGLDFDTAAIRAASPSRPTANRLKGNTFRALAEGAALFVLREHLKSSVLVGDPQTLATHANMAKPTLTERAKELSKRRFEAAIAAIAALPKV